MIIATTPAGAHSLSVVAGRSSAPRNDARGHSATWGRVRPGSVSTAIAGIERTMADV
jgi:hypothetical protein